MRLDKIKTILFQLTIFLIPANLAYHFITHSSYASGILVDYLIPKLYLSDLPILALLFIWFCSSTKPTSAAQYFKAAMRKLIHSFSFSDFPSYLSDIFYSFTNISFSKVLILLWISFVLVSTAVFSNTQSSWYYFIKIVEYTLFAGYLYTEFSLEKIKEILPFPLFAGIIFQNIVALTQFIKQSSLLGYILLGEITLVPTATISQSTLWGTRVILPYGTTPHPNILAGYLAISLLILTVLYSKRSKKRAFLSAYIASISLSIITIFITQSYSTIIAFICILLVYILKKPIINIFILLLAPLVQISSYLLILLSNTLNYQSYIPFDNPSVSRRIQLLTYSYKMLRENMLIGTGLNQFIPHLATYPPITATYRFLQPVHNIFILYLVELGLIGSLLLTGLILTYLSLARKRPKKALPLLTLIIIGFFDHYPLTLQTGQLLLTLSIVLPLLKDKKRV